MKKKIYLQIYFQKNLEKYKTYYLLEARSNHAIVIEIGYTKRMN